MADGTIVDPFVDNSGDASNDDGIGPAQETDNGTEETSVDVNKGVLDPFLVNKTDSFEVAFNKTELKVDALFHEFGPQAVALIPHLNTPSPEIPLASKPFPHTLKKVPGAGDTSLRIYNDGPLRFLIIAQLANHDQWSINKVGPYLDMLYQQNGREVRSFDTLLYFY